MTLNLENLQCPSSIVMIRPHNFMPNPETSCDNGFQITTIDTDKKDYSKLAFDEFNHAAEILENSGIKVHLFDDKSHATPDSVFLNNWFSTHPDGTVAIYPMYALNRRKERRTDVIDMLKREYITTKTVDYSGLEHHNVFLEGTGAMVIDHINNIAYMIASNRGCPILFQRFCREFNYQPFVFNALDLSGNPIYHTNVFMSIATHFALLSLDMIPDAEQRQNIVVSLQKSGRTIIDLTPAQVYQFAGNCIELTGTNGKILALSQSAYHCLSAEQISIIEKSTVLLPLNVNTIELGGGSVRCMIAAIHLESRV